MKTLPPDLCVLARRAGAKGEGLSMLVHKTQVAALTDSFPASFRRQIPVKEIIHGKTDMVASPLRNCTPLGGEGNLGFQGRPGWPLSMVAAYLWDNNGRMGARLCGGC